VAPVRRTPMLSTLAAATLTMPGCWVMSIHPLWLPDEPHPFNPRLVGDWWQQEDDCRWHITALNGEYHVTYTIPATHSRRNTLGESCEAEFCGYLAEIGNHRFLDLVPVNVIANNPQLVIAHAFYRVTVDQHAIELVPLNVEFVVRAIERREIAGRIDREHWANCAVITAATSKVRAFVSAHARDASAFTDVDEQGYAYWRFEPLRSKILSAQANAKGAGSCDHK
jgi:hypothetical protein